MGFISVIGIWQTEAYLIQQPSNRFSKKHWSEYNLRCSINCTPKKSLILIIRCTSLDLDSCWDIFHSKLPILEYSIQFLIQTKYAYKTCIPCRGLSYRKKIFSILILVKRTHSNSNKKNYLECKSCGETLNLFLMFFFEKSIIKKRHRLLDRAGLVVSSWTLILMWKAITL